MPDLFLNVHPDVDDYHFERQETTEGMQASANREFPVMTVTGLSRLNPSPTQQIDILAGGDGPYNNSLSFDIVPAPGSEDFD